MKASSIQLATFGMALSALAAPVNEPKVSMAPISAQTGPILTNLFTPAPLPSINIASFPFSIPGLSLPGFPGHGPTTLPPCPTPTLSTVTLGLGSPSTFTTATGNSEDPYFDTTLRAPTGTPGPRTCIPQTGSSPGSTAPGFNPETTRKAATWFHPETTVKTAPGFNPETTRKTVPGFSGTQAQGPEVTTITLSNGPEVSTITLSSGPHVYTTTVESHSGGATPTGRVTGI